MPSALPKLNLARMHERHPGLTKALSDCNHQAARVCLSRHHTPPITVTVSDGRTHDSAEIVWRAPNTRTRGAWNNDIDTTEAGAYCCVLACVEHLRGLVAVRRAETGTGADYYVGHPGAGVQDLEDCLRLEVSGTDGDVRQVEQRLRQKVTQARNGSSPLPAIAGVVGFSARTIQIADVPE